MLRIYHWICLSKAHQDMFQNLLCYIMLNLNCHLRMDCDVVDFEPYLDVFLTGTSSLIGTIKKVKFDDLDIRRTQFIAAIKRFLGEGTYIVVFFGMYVCMYIYDA